MTSTAFAGFRPSLFGFLEELAEHNDRAWFAEHKPRYERDVLASALAFITAMGPEIERISPHFLAVAKRSGGSLMRVYRDTRFGNDKRPYKTNVGIQFRHTMGKDVHAPGFYVHLEPGSVFLGAGMWRPEPGALGKIRDLMVARPGDWEACRDDPQFSRHFELAGERLKRPPRGYDADHPLLEDLKRKDFIGICDLDQSAALDDGFAGRVVEMFESAVPIMRFLCRAVEVPF